MSVPERKFIQATIRPRRGGVARMLVPVDKVLFLNDGEDNQGEIMLITGASFTVAETLEELGAQVGAQVEPLPDGDVPGPGRKLVVEN